MKKIKIKRHWLRLWGPSEIHGPLLGSPDSGPIYRLNPLLMGPAFTYCCSTHVETEWSRCRNRIFSLSLEKSEGTIKERPSRNTGNSRLKTQSEGNNKPQTTNEQTTYKKIQKSNQNKQNKTSSNILIYKYAL